MIKSVNECPKSKVYFENDGSKSETLNFYLTPSKHNQGSVGTDILERLGDFATMYFLFKQHPTTQVLL